MIFFVPKCWSHEKIDDVSLTKIVGYPELISQW